MLLIFVTETTETNNSDVMYIKKYLNTRFHLDKNTVIKWVYLNSKRISDWTTQFTFYYLCLTDTKTSPVRASYFVSGISSSLKIALNVSCPSRQVSISHPFSCLQFVRPL